MAEGAPIRLSKALRELNVGMNSVVDFLDTKGISIDARPNTKLDVDTYGLLVEEFAPDRAKKQKSEALADQVVVRETITLADQKKSKIDKKQDQDEILIKNVGGFTEVEVIAPEPVVEEKPAESEKKEEPTTEAPKETPKQTTPPAPKSGPTVVGTIDLSTVKSNRPTKKEEPKATDHIPEMLEMIQSLVDQDKAYESGGDVFYSIKSFKEYGCLSGKNIDDLQSGARVEVNDTKKDPLDFVLWKKSKPGEPSWDSPWGQGRPGWHIECSAMSKKYLGDTFDIHGGGKDLVFPHHENEIAQSFGCTGKQPVRYWVHNGFVNIDKEKMSKSLGNFFTLRDVYKKYHPEVLRLFLISSQYRSPIDFSEKNLEDATKVTTRFYEGLAGANEKLKGLDTASISGFQSKIKKHALTKSFEAAMDDDLNTAVVMASLNEGLRGINSALSSEENLESLAVSTHAWLNVGKVIGLFSRTPEQFETELFEIKNENLNLDINKIEKLIADRNAARSSKNWAEADCCRDELTAMGVLIEDTANGTDWKIK